MFFSANGFPGMNMGDALRRQFAGLDGRDDPMFGNAVKAISCRFLVWFFPWFLPCTRADTDPSFLGIQTTRFR